MKVVADKAPGTTVLGVLDGAEDRACFEVAETGAALADGRVASARMGPLFTNENSSGGSRRVFLALTGWGRLLFVRAAQWALGEELEPYEALRITDVTPAEGRKVTLSWAPGAASKGCPGFANSRQAPGPERGRLSAVGTPRAIPARGRLLTAFA